MQETEKWKQEDKMHSTINISLRNKLNWKYRKTGMRHKNFMVIYKTEQ